MEPINVDAKITEYIVPVVHQRETRLNLFYDMINLLRRWTVRAGGDNPDLADKTLRLIKGRG